MNTPVVFLTIALAVFVILVVWLAVQLVRTSAERARLGRALRDAVAVADLWRNAAQKLAENLEALRKERME
jgi:hypothetical protein